MAGRRIPRPPRAAAGAGAKIERRGGYASATGPDGRRVSYTLKEFGYTYSVHGPASTPRLQDERLDAWAPSASYFVGGRRRYYCDSHYRSALGNGGGTIIGLLYFCEECYYRGDGRPGWEHVVHEGGADHTWRRCGCGEPGRERQAGPASAPISTAGERRRAAIAAAALGRRGEGAAAHYRAHVPWAPPRSART